MTPTQKALPELLPNIRALARPDKFRLLHFLAVELACEEGVLLIEPDASYPIWTPHNSYDAAATLLRALQPQGSQS